MRNEWQDEAVKKTSWPQEDGPAAAGAAQHRNLIGRTSIEMGLIRQLAAGADGSTLRSGISMSNGVSVALETRLEPGTPEISRHGGGR